MSELKTLLLKTDGMSAYGLQTFDVHRRVNHFPTRSSVIGLLGAALGITRARYQELFELSKQLKIAVQVNKVGQKITDYHTVQDFRSPHGKIQLGQTKPTYREYRCDTEYTFAITAGSTLIDALTQAVHNPVFNLFQGRKSCPLYRPLFEAIAKEPNPANALKHAGSTGQIFSDVSGENQVAMLQVRDFNTSVARKYAMRTVYVCGYNDAATGKGSMDQEEYHK